MRGFVVYGLLVVAAQAQAEARAFEGRYFAGSKSYSQELRISKRADGRFDVRGEVATSGCVGEVDAVGEIAANKMTAREISGTEACVLTVSRTQKGVRVDEDHCLPFHGAACEFSGDYRKR